MPASRSSQIVDLRALLRDDGLSYMAYTEQIIFLLFLKMAHEQTLPPYNRLAIAPPEPGSVSLLARDGDELEVPSATSARRLASVASELR
jgi:hypothetical protein